MDSKKLTQIATILILGISIALTGTVVATKIAKQKSTTLPYSEPEITQNITETTIATTTMPKETVPMGGNSVITTAVTQKPQWKIDEEASISASISQAKAKTTTKKTTTKPTTRPAYSGIVPQTRAAVIESYIKGVENLKKTKNFNLTRSGGKHFTVNDITGGYLVQQATETFIKYNDISMTETFDFKMGVDSTTGFTPKDVLPPYEGTAKLKDSAVYSATAKALSDGGYTVTIKLKDEHQSMYEEAENHKAVTETLDVQEMFRTAEIESYELNYSGTTITALFDKNNRITYIEHFIPVKDATANGTLSYIPFTVTFNCEDVVQYDISY